MSLRNKKIKKRDAKPCHDGPHYFIMIIFILVVCTVYSRGRQPFVVSGPKNGKIVNPILLRAIPYIFLPISFKFFDDFFLLLRI